MSRRMIMFMCDVTEIKIRVKSGRKFLKDHEYHTERIGKKEIDIYFNGMYMACVEDFGDVIDHICDNYHRDLKEFRRVKGI